MIITIVYKNGIEGLKDPGRRHPEEPYYRLKTIDFKVVVSQKFDYFSNTTHSLNSGL